MLFIKFIILISTCMVANVSCLDHNTEYLTDLFFANLKSDPHIKGKARTFERERYANNQIFNYVELMKRSKRNLNNNNIVKRSLATPTDVLTRLTIDPFGTTEVENINFVLNISQGVVDTQVFYHYVNQVNKIFLAGITTDTDSYANKLFVWEYNANATDNPIERDYGSMKIVNGTRMGLMTYNNVTYIAVAEYRPISNNYNSKTAIFQFSPKDGLKVIQRIDVPYATDVIFWVGGNMLYLAFASEKTVNDDKVNYVTQSPIYIWLGKHFDLVNTVKTYSPIRLTAFNIGSFTFLVVGNSKNVYGEKETYTDVFRQDLNDEKYKLHQRLISNDIVDVKYFCFSKTYEKESFLIISNNLDLEAPHMHQLNIVFYKYVDDYFIPFQGFNIPGLIEWLPVIGKKGEFALLASTKTVNLRIYGYDGWRFAEVSTYVILPGIKGIIAGMFYAPCGCEYVQPMLTTISSDDGHISTYSVEFIHKSPLTSYQDELLIWCRKKLEEAYSVTGKNITIPPSSSSQVKNDGNHNNNEQIGSKARFNHERLDDVDSAQEDEIAMLNERLSVLATRANALKNESDALQDGKISYTAYGHVIINNLHINGSSEITGLETNILNNKDMANLLDNMLLLNDNAYVRTPLKFDKIETNNIDIINSVNGISPDNIIHKNDDINLKKLTIDGSVKFKNKLTVFGRLDGVKFSNNEILLSNQPQTFEMDLLAKNLSINNLMASNSDFLTPKTINVTNNIKAMKIHLQGFMNNVNISRLPGSILKSDGDQEINAQCVFDNLKVNSLNTKLIDGKDVSSDLIYINGNKQEINRDVQFENEIVVNNLFVRNRLNNIKVIDGNLDVLLKNGTTPQRIDGYKLMENVELTDHIKYRGRIDDRIRKLFAPVANYDGELIINGSKEIDGTVTVESQMKTNNLYSNMRNYSIKRVQLDGLKLSEESVPMHLKFRQQQHVDEVFAERINNLDAHSWIHNTNAENEKQIVKGKKVFLNNLHVTRSLQIRNVNDINVYELNENVLNVNDDQNITGKHHIEELLVPRMLANQTYFNGQKLKNLITKDVAILENVQAKSIKALNVKCDGDFNGINITYLLEDTVFESDESTVTGQKIFENLKLDDVNVEKGFNMTKLPKEIRSNLNRLGDVDLPPNINVKNIEIRNFLNDIPTNKITSGELCQNIIINGKQDIEKLIGYKNVFIKGNNLNGLDITDVKEKTIKINEPFEFDAVYLENIVSYLPVKVDGQIADIDLKNIVTNNPEDDNLSLNKKNFHDNVYVGNNLLLGGLVNGVNMSKLCSFTLPAVNDFASTLTVHGSALFEKGLNIKYVNNKMLNTILSGVWFTNENTILNERVAVNGTIHFNHLNLKGLLNNVDLSKLSKEYFSISKNQTVNGTLQFTDGILFKNLGGKELLTKSVYGINLGTFVRTAILNDVDQVFENSLLLENCTVFDLQGQYSLNNLDVVNDFMRYNSDNNFVTGSKTFNNLKVNSLKIDRKYNVKDVDLLTWIYRSIKTTLSNIVEFPILFTNATYFKEGLSIQGLLNGLSFTKNDILLKSVDQNVTRNKRFSKEIEMNSVTLHGLLNNVDMGSLMDNEMKKCREVKIKTPITLKNELKTANLDIKNLYNDVNVSQMVDNINNLATINNYADHYANLFNVAWQIRSSLIHQAYFINYYKEVQLFTDHQVMLHLKINHVQRIAGLQNGKRSSEVIFYVWNPDLYQFVIDPSLPKITFYENITNIKSIKLPDDNSYLYVESFNQKDKTYIGKVIYLNSINSIIDQFTYEGRKTRFLSGIFLPNSSDNCLLTMYYNIEFAHIFCAPKGKNYMVLKQMLYTKNARKATSINIEENLYILITSPAREQKDSYIDMWKYDLNEQQFLLHDVIYVVGPRSLSSISYKGEHYLAIASGLIKNTMYSGTLQIMKFNKKSMKFITWQTLAIQAPNEVKFFLLPSNELLLYVLTQDLAEPLRTYIYDGIFGFKEHLRAMKTMKITDIDVFNTNDNKHFIIAHNKDVMVSTVIEGIFKGHS